MPGMARALSASTRCSSPWATGLRTKIACSTSGRSISSTNRPAPRNSLASSRRGTDRPINAEGRSFRIVMLAEGQWPWAAYSLLRLDSARLHEWAPAPGCVVGGAPGLVGPEPEHRLEAGVDEPFLELAVAPLCLGHLVDLVECRLRGAGGRKHAKEGLRDEIRQPCFGGGGDIRHGRE